MKYYIAVFIAVFCMGCGGRISMRQLQECVHPYGIMSSSFWR